MAHTETITNIVGALEAELSSLRAEVRAATQAKATADKALAVIRASVDEATRPDLWTFRYGLIVDDKALGYGETQASGFAPLIVCRESVSTILTRPGGLGQFDQSGRLDSLVDNDAELFELTCDGRRVFALMTPAELEAFKFWLVAAPAAKKGVARA